MARSLKIINKNKSPFTVALEPIGDTFDIPTGSKLVCEVDTSDVHDSEFMIIVRDERLVIELDDRDVDLVQDVRVYLDGVLKFG